MDLQYKIGIYLKSYAVDKPSAWKKNELQSIDRPSAYRIDYYISLFLIYINDNYKLVYFKQPYNHKILDTIKSLSEGLHLLHIDVSKNTVLSFYPLFDFIMNNEVEMNFENIKVQKIRDKIDFFFFNSNNIKLFISDKHGKKNSFSLIEQNWANYEYEITVYDLFITNIKEKFHNYIKAYKSTRNEIQKYDLQEILKDLSVEIDEIFINKIGGDDRYYVDETRNISYPVEKLDHYLKEYIKIGRRNIYSDSGYTSAYNMAIKDLKTGVLPKEDVSNLRKKMIANYSAEEHIFTIIDKCIEKYKNYLRIPCWHRLNSYGMISYFMSPSFVSDLENIIGGGCYIVEWDNLDSLIENANNHIQKLKWWKE